MPESSQQARTAATFSGALKNAVAERLTSFVAEREALLAPLGEEPRALVELSHSYLSGGKRFRAQFCYWGFVGQHREVSQGPGQNIVTLAAALELFHAAALVHDDLIDHSDLRRGEPSAHRSFQKLHEAKNWEADAAAFGEAAAILLGDLFIVWSDELLDEALSKLDASTTLVVREEYNRMRTQVTAGQYLDVVGEHAWRDRGTEDAQHAMRVIIYKSAKYSVESPLALGALLAGAAPDSLAGLRAFGLELGIAYQLRDDLLGIYGDSAVTGKPSGDDIREGKRTVLVAEARKRLSAADRDWLDGLLGNDQAAPQQLARAQELIKTSGATAYVENLIQSGTARALTALERCGLNPVAKDALQKLAQAVTVREA